MNIHPFLYECIAYATAHSRVHTMYCSKQLNCHFLQLCILYTVQKNKFCLGIRSAWPLHGIRPGTHWKEAEK